jgi:hypothetical protein
MTCDENAAHMENLMGQQAAFSATIFIKHMFKKRMDG